MSVRIVECPVCGYNKDFPILKDEIKTYDSSMYRINTKCPDCGLEFCYNNITKNRGSKF